MKPQGNGEWSVKVRRVIRRGFTLVEILFAVLVLAIALLGLGAFFPAVIRTQQAAQDSTLGVIAAQSAEALFRGRTYRLGTARMSFEEYMLAMARAQPSFLPDDGSWVVGTRDDDIDASGTAAIVIGLDPIASPSINLADRLYPTDDSGVAEPKLVWDAAFRRAVPRVGTQPSGAAGEDTVQVAVFVRRIDPRIRTPRGVPLFRALQDPTLPAENRRWPVSVGLSGGAVGEPTLDGRVGQGGGGGATAYSPIVPVSVYFSEVPTGGADRSRRRDLLTVVAPQGAMASMDVDRLFQLVSQPGQQIVDNLGNTYNVVGAEPAVLGTTSRTLRISPPVPEGVPETSTGAAGALRSILITPQAPSAVRVFTVKP